MIMNQPGSEIAARTLLPSLLIMRQKRLILGSIGICLLLTGCGATPPMRAVLPPSSDANAAAGAPRPTPTLVPTWTPVNPVTMPASIDLLVGPLPVATPTLPRDDSRPIQVIPNHSVPPDDDSTAARNDITSAGSDSTTARNEAMPANSDSTSVGSAPKPKQPSETDRRPGRAEPKPPKAGPKPPKAHPAPRNDDKGNVPKGRGGEKGPGDDKGRGGKRGG